MPPAAFLGAAGAYARRRPSAVARLFTASTRAITGRMPDLVPPGPRVLVPFVVLYYLYPPPAANVAASDGPLPGARRKAVPSAGRACLAAAAALLLPAAAPPFAKGWAAGAAPPSLYASLPTTKGQRQRPALYAYILSVYICVRFSCVCY